MYHARTFYRCITLPVSFDLNMTTVFLQSLHDKTPIETLVSIDESKPSAPAVILAHPYGPLGKCIRVSCFLQALNVLLLAHYEK